VPDPTAKAVISFAGIAAAVIATTSSAAVVIHLKKNRTKIYTEESYCKSSGTGIAPEGKDAT